MARNYCAVGAQATVSSSYKSVLGITSATTVRPKIKQISFGSSGTPADYALVYLLQRYTAAGTNTSVTPQALDPGDPAALASAGSNHTVEPTYTSNAYMLQLDLNVKGTFMWYAIPGCEIVLPATASNGVGIQVKSASYNSQVDSSIYHEE